MKKYFLSAVGGTLMMASAAAQTATDEPVILRDDEDLLISMNTGQIEDGRGANGYYLMCPVKGGVTGLFDNKALVFLYSQSAESMAEASSAVRGAYPKGINIPWMNMGFIDDKNTVLPAYTIEELKDGFDTRIKGTETIEGSNPRNKTLLDNVAKHTRHFCFGSF